MIKDMAPRTVKFHTLEPRRPLADFVEMLWHYEAPAPRHRFERLLPSGASQLIINLNADSLRSYDSEDARRFETHRGPVIAGVQSRFALLDTAQQRWVMGVQFRPGGVLPMFGISAEEFRDRDLALSAVWGAPALELSGRLHDAPGAHARLRLLEAELLRRLGGGAAMHPAIERFARHPGGAPLAAAARDAGLSQRRFIELFRRHVGLTPGLYCRVRRFQWALARLHRLETVDWCGLALEAGYCDQSHFIREFREFTGLTPTACHALRGAHANHIPLPDGGQFHPIRPAREIAKCLGTSPPALS